MGTPTAVSHLQTPGDRFKAIAGQESKLIGSISYETALFRDVLFGRFEAPSINSN